VLFSRLCKYDGEKNRHPERAPIFHQISVRAGRKGISMTAAWVVAQVARANVGPKNLKLEGKGGPRDGNKVRPTQTAGKEFSSTVTNTLFLRLISAQP